MSMVTLAQAKAQSRILQNAEDVLVQGYIDAAELHAQKFLNRNVYPDGAAWTSDKAKLTDATASDAEAAYNAAIAAIGIFPDVNFGRDSFGQPSQPTFVQQLALDKANEDFQNVKDSLARILYGMVISPTFVQAIILTTAHWWVNRETVLTELNSAIELPFGARALLEPDRRQMGA